MSDEKLINVPAGTYVPECLKNKTTHKLLAIFPKECKDCPTYLKDEETEENYESVKWVIRLTMGTILGTMRELNHRQLQEISILMERVSKTARDMRKSNE